MATGTADAVGGWGNAATAVGDLAKGFAESGADKYQSQIYRNNAEIARYNAQRETQAGEIAAESLGLKTRAIVGQTKAAQAASGIDVNTGSAVSVQESERVLGLLDAMTIRSNAALKAYGYQSEAATNLAKAEMARRASSFAKLGGILDASGTILEGAASTKRKQRAKQDVTGDENLAEWAGS
jgi:hypothetical protein